MIKLKEKLRSNSGESISETLFALLIGVLALTMLSASLVSAAKINKNTDQLETAFVYSNQENVSGTVIIYHNTDSSANKNTGAKTKTTADVNCYCTDDDNAYCYYMSK